MQKNKNIISFQQLKYYEAHFATAKMNFDFNSHGKFNQNHHQCPYPIVWHKAKYSELIDLNDQVYVDLCASFGSLPLGHNHPKIIDKICEYVKKGNVMQGMSDVYSSSIKSKLLKTISMFIPDEFDKIALSVTGSDAVELALKTSMLYTQKPGVLVLKEGYHGLNIGSMVLTGMKKFSDIFKNTWQNHPNVYYVSYKDNVDVIYDLIKNSQFTSNPIGQIIIEPVLGRGGIITIDHKFLKELKAIINEYKGLLIFDEVYTGIGRCGVNCLSCEIDCDILCLGKALGGGMPVSCVCASEEIFASWPENSSYALHTGTFYGHPLSLAVANETLLIIKKLNLIQAIKDLSMELDLYFHDQIKKSNYLFDNSIKGVGLMRGIDLKVSNSAVKLANILVKKNIITVPCGENGSVLSLTPALNIQKDLLYKSLDMIFFTLKSEVFD